MRDASTSLSKCQNLFVWLVVLGVIGFLRTEIVRAQGTPAVDMAGVESRLRAIYEDNAFRAKSFRGQWLPDSSAYTVLESAEGSDERVLMQYDPVTGERRRFDSQDGRGDSNSETSPDGRYSINVEGGNLHIRDLHRDQRIQLTQNAQEGTVWNRSSVWSPDGSRIAFIESDYTNVRSRAMLLPTDPSYPEITETHFARVGEKIPALRIGVVDVEGRQTRWLSLAEPAEGFYLGEVNWAGNSNELFVEQRSRFRDEREFLLANVVTGEVRRIFHETDPAWVVASIRKNAGVEWIRGGREFIVLSEKDGWRHAYRYSRDGEELGLLTKGPYDIIERVTVDEAGGWFYFNASPENATQKYLYRVRLDGSDEAERVTPPDQPGTHDYDFSPDAKWAFHTYSTFDSPPVVELVKFPEHKVVRVLEDNNELRARAKSANTQPAEFLQLDIGDGVVMDAWMIRPTNFDPNKKYPLVVYVYGEPHAQTVLDAWGKVHADYHRTIADLGYIVISIDNRGTPAPKGAAWRRSIFGKLGVLSTEEQAKGILELGRQRPYIDLSRVGTWGWSGGGSNTLNAMFRRPDVFHVGIAVAPKPQPHLYNAWFQEIYMETRETNPEGYRDAAPINFAEGLQGDLLMIHGTGETNTHLEIIEGLVDRLIELGKPFDYMTYPQRDHGIRKGKGTSVHLRMHMIRYWLSHLPRGPR